ncbi:uncharacterized protein BDV14DRAFT_181323 [Aspergillus stella-maris]|uniref:uncharacterized protein n=1 Tax=Aspergillus stella-maris TaxID=1810926 RepID=UPI003CCDF5D9
MVLRPRGFRLDGAAMAIQGAWEARPPGTMRYSVSEEAAALRSTQQVNPDRKQEPTAYTKECARESCR